MSRKVQLFVKPFIILYADDTALLSETEEGLNKYLTFLRDTVKVDSFKLILVSPKLVLV